MLYQVLLWPEQFDMRLRPFALDHAAYLWDHFLNGRMGIAPIEIYRPTKLDFFCLKNEHAWGYVVYSLDPRLQDSKQIPK